MSYLERLLLQYYRKRGFDALTKQEVFELVYLELKLFLEQQRELERGTK